MVILDNSRTLGAFERQSRILHITPYLQELQENTIIPDYTTLISITTNQEPIYESEHIIILDSDSTIGCQE